MTKEQRVNAVARRIAWRRGAPDPSDYTEAEHDEAEKFVELYDVLRQAEVQSEQFEQTPPMLTNDERRKLTQMLRERDTQEDATIIWLCQVALDLNKRLGEIRAIVNRK